MQLLLFCLFALLLLFPESAFTGAKNGLLLWFHTVLPTLFPFIFLTTLMIRKGTAKKISHILHPVLSPLLNISTDSCFCILVGLLAGIPLGAKTCARLVSDHSISLSEGQYLLCFCNNASPAFIISYIGTSLLNLPYWYCLLLWCIITLSGILTGYIYRALSFRLSKIFMLHSQLQINYHPDMIQMQQTNPAGASSFLSPVEDALETALQTITRIGGYIILFSLLGQLSVTLSELILQTLGTLANSSVTAHQLFSNTLSQMVQVSSAMICGILEITSGCSFIAKLSIGINIKTVLICSITAFGGLSGIWQTKSVMSSSGLSLSCYLIVKVIHAFLSGILAACITLVIDTL